MAKKQGYGRSASVPTGDYRGYKRAIEERRRQMGMMEEDEPGYDDMRRYGGADDAEPDTQDMAQASGMPVDDELSEVLGLDDAADMGSEDEDSMPAPRRRARAYRSGQELPRDDERGDEPDYRDEYREDDERPARRAPRPQRDRRNPRAHEDEFERPARPSRAAHRPPQRDASSQESDDLEDYRGDDTAYSDDVYEPYEYEDDMDGDYEEEGSATEWADGIKRALDKGKAGFKALKAKAGKGGGKKRPPAKKKRRPQQRRTEPERARQVDDELPQIDLEELEELEAPQEQMQQEPARRINVDLSEYQSVSDELEQIEEEQRPVSRRERRMLRERQTDAADELPAVNIVSRKAMRAQQEEAAQEQAAQQQAEEQAAQEQLAMEQAAEEQQAASEQLPAEPEQTFAEEYGIQPVQQDEYQPEQPEGGMMFGIQGRQHVMQPEPMGDTGTWGVPEFAEAPQEEQAEPAPEQPQPEQDDDDEPAGKGRSKKERRGRKAKNHARRRDYDLEDDDDDDAQSAAPVSDQTALYTRRPSAPMYLGDDDDEPEDDMARAAAYAGDDAGEEHGFIAPDNDFSDDPYIGGMYGNGRSEDEDEDYGEDDYGEEEERESRGGCLKAFTIILVILLVAFGTVWALDYFGVINVRNIVSDITSKPIFDPLRGNLLPAATQGAPASSDAPDSVPTIQPAESGATAIPNITDGQPAAPTSAAGQPDITASPENGSQANALSASADAAPTDAPATQPTPGIFTLNAQPVEAARPDSDTFDLEYGVYVDYERDREYSRPEPISFGLGKDYTNLEGVVTFRGNNFRENAAYGTASLEQKKFDVIWKNKIGSIDSGYAVWSGVGWNGQPVMIHWSDEMRQMMNIRDEFKQDSELVEVIYGTLDGNIYFLDSRTGDYTRDPIELGFPMKGSVSIDPRGYPLLYVGQGISKANGRTGSIGWRVYNLLNQEHMYLLNGHDELRFRTHGSFDGVCLLDAETDTIIEGAENGIFYTIKLNTNFDWNAQTISIDPVVTLYRYKSRLSRAIGDEGLGIENSVAAFGQYAYFIDNSGLLTCIDLNTMTPAWLFDVGDDTDASISLEQLEDGSVMLYTINEVDKQGKRGDCTMRKINALTGEQQWSYSVECKSDGSNGGGGFASPALGKNSLSGIVYFNAARTDGGGTLYAFDKESGEIIWKKTTGRYSWSSPVLVYNEAGEGVVVLGNSGGVLRMYDGLTGEVYDEIEIDGNMEGSPAVYDDTLVIGTRDCKIYGIKIL